MERSFLHEFDIDLCRLVRSNVRGPIGTADPNVLALAAAAAAGRAAAGRAAAGPRRGRTDPFAKYTALPIPAGYLRWLRDQLPPGLAAFVEAAEPAALLLTTADFEALATALEDMPALGGPRNWEPWPALHRRYAECLPEVRAGLASAVAEAFATSSARTTAALERTGLRVFAGVRLVGDWVFEVRRLLAAAGRADLLPRPDGAWPTPALPDEALGADVMALIERIRVKLDADPRLRRAGTKEVIRTARCNTAKGMRALKWLKATGEYHGPA